MSESAESNAEDDEDDLGESEYEIEHIIKSRIRKTGGKKILEFLIHWKGYQSEDDSWTTADQFDEDDPPVLKFYTKNPSAAKRADLLDVKEREKKSIRRKKKRTPSPVKSESEADDEDDEPVLVGSTSNGHDNGSTPKKTPVKANPQKSSPVDGIAKQSGLLNYFSFDKKGKENEGVTPKSTSKVTSAKKAVPEKKTPKEKVEPKKTKIVKNEKEVKSGGKKRKADSDGSDFVMEDAASSAEDDEEEDGLEGGEESDDEVKSDSLESVEDDIGQFVPWCTVVLADIQR